MTAPSQRIVAGPSSTAVIPPTCPSRGYESPYREGKLAAHTTVAGRGTVARALGKRPR